MDNEREKTAQGFEALASIFAGMAKALSEVEQQQQLQQQQQQQQPQPDLHATEASPSESEQKPPGNRDSLPLASSELLNRTTSSSSPRGDATSERQQAARTNSDVQELLTHLAGGKLPDLQAILEQLSPTAPRRAFFDKATQDEIKVSEEIFAALNETFLQEEEAKLTANKSEEALQHLSGNWQRHVRDLSDSVPIITYQMMDGLQHKLKVLLDRVKRYILSYDKNKREEEAMKQLFNVVQFSPVDEVEEVLKLQQSDETLPDDLINKLLTTDKGGLLTALHIASRDGRTRTVQLLLKFGARVDPVSIELFATPLYLAAMKGAADSARTLLQAGANCCIFDTVGVTPLSMAAHQGHANILADMLESSKDIFHSGQHNHAFVRALFDASSRGNAECVRLLLETGVDADCVFNGVATPLQMASQGGHLTAVRLLLQHGASPNLKAGPPNLLPIDLALTGNSGKPHLEVVYLLKDAMSPDAIEQIANKAAFQAAMSIKGTDQTAQKAALGAAGHYHNKSKVRCTGCDDLLDRDFYMCYTCQEAFGAHRSTACPTDASGCYRKYCVYCVLGPGQKANQICVGHVLMRSGDPFQSPTLIRGERPLVTTSRTSGPSQTKWMEVTVLQTEGLKLESVAKLIAGAASEKDFNSLLGIALDSMDLKIEIDISVVDKFDASAFQRKVGNELSKAAPHLVRRHELLYQWLKARLEHPASELPSWVRPLGCSRNGSLASYFFAWYSVFSIGDTINTGLDSVSTNSSPLVTTMLDELPVAMLPCTELFRMDRMPEYRDCSSVSNCKSEQPGPTLKMFVSHAWRDNKHPDKDGLDWQLLRRFFCEEIKHAIWLYRTLETFGLSSTHILEQAFVNHIPEEWLERMEEHGSHVHETVGRGEGIASVRIDALMAELLEVVDYCRDSDAGDIFERVAGRLYLWIDFVCLPQSVTVERTPEERKWFKESLRHMGHIQRRMRTLVVNTDERYVESAWCTAEFINTDGTFLVVDSKGFKPIDCMKANIHTCLRVMLGTQAVSAMDVISSLKLTITNGDDSDSVCRVLWSRVGPYLQGRARVQRSVLTPSSSWIPQDSWEVTQGPPDAVRSYLKAAQSKTFLDYEQWLSARQPFAILNSKPQDVSSYEFLAGSSFRFFDHLVLGTLGSITGFLDTYAESLSIAESGYIRISLVKRFDPNCHVTVAFPTSIYAEHADVIVLPEAPLTFQEVDKSGPWSLLVQQGEKGRQLDPKFGVIPVGTRIALRQFTSREEQKFGMIKACDASSGVYSVQMDGSSEITPMLASDFVQNCYIEIHGAKNPQVDGIKGKLSGWDDEQETYRIDLDSDPLGFGDIVRILPKSILLPKGTVVRLTGLTSKPELNGRFGTVMHVKRSTNQYYVQLSEQQVVVVLKEKVVV